MQSVGTLPVKMAGMEEEWLTVGQIAERLQVAERTVRRWLTDGELVGANFGGKAGWRIRGRDLDAFIDKRFGKATQDAP
jgi:excisionase family DNA binding protein